MEITLSANPTQRQFVTSNKHITVLIGPQGEGKSWAAMMAMFYHAHEHKRQIRGLIVRDSFRNIERNTNPTIMKMLQGYATFHNGGRKLKCPELDVDLYGIDDVAALSSLMGAEYEIAWIEEPAPIYEVGNAGIREDVFTMVCARGPRSLNSRHRVLVTMNPASEEHWTHHRFIDDPEDDMDIINIPYGENKFLPEYERANTKKAFIHRPDLYTRFVEGKFAFTAVGQAVTPEYREEIHRSKKILKPSPLMKTYRFWDGGLFPSCVIGQVTPRGRFIVFDSMRGDNMGMKQFIMQYVKPKLGERYPGFSDWYDSGDPNLSKKAEGDDTVVASQIINSELDAAFIPGISGWEERKEAVKEMLSRLVDGHPALVLSKNEGLLHQAFRGGWHYAVNPAGQVVGKIPVKDINSHPADAFCHGIAKVFRYEESTPAKFLKKIKSIAKSYSVGNQ